MAAFPLPLTFDKRMTPPPVGCQGDWGLAIRADAPAAHFAGFASFGRSLCLDGLCERVAVKMGTGAEKLSFSDILPTVWEENRSGIASRCGDDP
jgi:hypothetical protein